MSLQEAKYTFLDSGTAAAKRMTSERITEFKGYNARGVREDGEMKDMSGLTSDEYPMLSVSKAPMAYGLVQYKGATQMLSKTQIDDDWNHDVLYVIAQDSDNKYRLYKDGTVVSGLELSADTQMVAINDKICFFPEKKWYSVKQGTVGSMDYSSSCEDESCYIGGNEALNLASSTVTFEDDSDLDLSGIGVDDVITLNFNADKELVFGGVSWHTLTEEGVLVRYDPVVNIIRGYRHGDKFVTTTSLYQWTKACQTREEGVVAKDEIIALLRTVEGFATVISASETTLLGNYGEVDIVDETFRTPYTAPSRPTYQINYKFYMKNAMTYEDSYTVDGIKSVTGLVKEVTGNSITLQDNSFQKSNGEQITGQTILCNSISIARTSPDLDFVIEWNNRLWGCSNTDNTIYCSKLGDPTNWQYYQNTSLDSYFAEQGSNGRWTGVGKYSTHLLFFKEDCVHKVYGNYPSEFQIVTQMCSGVREGSHKSVVTMEDGVLYHSRRGIMAYTGGIPTLISSEFGSIRYYDAVAGTDGYKYYVSLRDKWGAYSTFVYDADVGMWHRLGAYNISEFELHGNDLVYALSSEAAAIPKRTTDDATTYMSSWYAVFGPFDEYIENEKIYSIISIRYELATGKKLKVQISMDDGAWEQIEEVTGGATTGHEIEFIPERCDRFAIRLSGDGECKIKSLSRDFRVGSVQKENY